MKFKIKLALLLLTLCGLHYAYSDCPDSFFDCKNGKCIALFFKCDDDNDCGNFQDEINCIGNGSSNGNQPTFQLQKSCPADHFACEDEFNTCIPNRWICDGMQECSNGKDEANCTDDKVDCGEDFKCTNLQCVPSIWRCDGVSDCDDNSDELNCTSFKKKLMCDKEHGKYQCSTGECIDYSKTCDNKKDCLSGDDEGTLCHANACHDKKCSHLCLIDPKTNSSVCYCPPGFMLRNNTCTDYDECRDNKLTNVCSQKCLNLEGTFKCECFDDYELVGNSSCQIKNGSPVLYFSTGKEIRAFDLRNKTYYPIVETQRSEIIVGMDLIVKDKKLFYIGSEEDSHGSVYQLILGEDKQLQNNEQLLFHDNLKGIEGISVDWLAGNFYVTESSKNKIIVCDIDSTLCTSLLENLSSPRGILVLPLKGKMFWTQWGKKAAIFQSFMDGSEVSVLVDKVEWPNDLTIDSLMDRLYWCDGKDGLIEYYDFETKARHVVLKDPKRQPYSLFVFEDNLYWSDWTTNQIEVCDKITGHHVKPLLMDASHRFFGLTIYHPILQSSSGHKPYNPCVLHACSHLCLIKSPSSYSCHCPDHMVLTENGKTCREKNDEPYLLVNTGFKIFKYYANSITSSHSEKLAIFENFKISEFALNYNRNELYIFDTYKNRIGILNLNIQGPQQWKTLVKNDLHGIMSLVYDVNTDNLYWVDMLKGTLEVATTDGKSRANIVNDLEKPISLAINAYTRKMYIGLRSNPSQIISINMDGSSRRTLLVSQGGLPLAIATKPVDNELVWGDPIYKKIDFISIKDQMPKSQPQKIIDKDVQTVNSLALLNETIYWTNIESATLYYNRLSKDNNKRVTYHKNIIDDNIDKDLLKVIVGVKEHPVDVSCQKGNHKCSHICLLAPSGHTCKCSQGYTLSRNGISCTKARQEATNPVTQTFLDLQRFFDMISSKQNDHQDDENNTWLLKFDSKPNVSTINNSVEDSKPTVSPMPKPTTVKDDKADTDKVERADRLTFSKIITRLLIILILLLVVYVIYLIIADRQTLVRMSQQVRLGRQKRNDKPIRFFANPNYNPGFVNTECPAAKSYDQLDGIH